MNYRINRITALILAFALGPVIANATPTTGTPLLGANGNFYEFVDASGKNWPDADTEATGLTFNGIVGHLATITSAAEGDDIETLRLDWIANHSGVVGELYVGGFQNPSTQDCLDAITMAEEAQCGWTWVNGEGTFPGVNGAGGFDNSHSNWQSSEPNDSGSGESHLAIAFFGDRKLWNDEGALVNIKGYVVEYDFASVFVPPGEDEVFTDGANDPFSPHGVTAAYQDVLEGGNWGIHCCTVVDWREGAGSGKKYGDYLPVDLDLGTLIDTTAGCEALRVYGPLEDTFGSWKALLHPWQRCVPDPDEEDRTNTKCGVCLIQSEVIARGVLFTEEEPENVLGYPVDCSKPQIDDRPYTSGVAIVPTDVDSPYAIRESADCDGSRSGKRSSDRLIVLNEWHYTKHKKTQPYLSMLAASLLQVIDDERTRMPACVSNAEGYLDDLTSLVQDAKNEMKKKGDPDKAEDALNEATRLALLIPTLLPGSPSLPTVDPYFSTMPFCLANNAQGLIAGRLMAVKFGNCSENIHATDNSSSSVLGDEQCVIETDIFDEMPPLP